MLCEQDTKVLEIFRLVLLAHVHLARLSRQKHAARTKQAPPVWVFSEYVSARSPSHGWRAWGQDGQFFFPFGLSFVFFFLCYCSMKTNSLKPSCLFGRAIWSGFSLIPTVQMGFQRNPILHPTVKFQGHDQWTASFALKPCQTAANNISFVESMVTEGSEVSDIENTVSWVTRLCFKIMLYCHKLLIVAFIHMP